MLQVFLRPFIAACEQKHTKLVAQALGTIAKLVQRKLVSNEGRTEIIKLLISRVRVSLSQPFYMSLP